MSILVSHDAPPGFDLSLTVPRGFNRDLLTDQLARVLKQVSFDNKSSVQIWLEDSQPEDDALMGNLSFSSYRDLWQMRCAFPPLGAAISTRTFIAGADNDAFLAVNARAFSWHPEQGGLDSEQLEKIFLEDWFDSEGFLLLEIDNSLAGFCWTKLHRGESLVLGEIYAIAIDPDFHGKGYGKPLTIAGLNHLMSIGADLGMLYVESDNKPAIRIYEDIGFTHFSTNRAYQNRT